MKLQILTKRLNFAKQITILRTQLRAYCFNRLGMASTHLIGISLATILVFNTALADPALMQPVEDIHFKELPPPWFASGVSGFTVKTVVPASSRPDVKQAQAPRPAVPVPAAHPIATTPQLVPAQSSIQSIINSANKGDRNAQYDLGMRYQYGNGVKKSRNKAHRWLNKSAQAGSPRAQYALSLFYQQYARNTQGIKKALLWIKKSADQGLADAQYSLGMMFRNGSLVQKNPVEARKWLRRASIQGHMAAQLAMSN